MEREAPEAAFQQMLGSDEVWGFPGVEYEAPGRRSATHLFEVSGSRPCPFPCPYGHNHGEAPVVAPTWPPALEEDLYQCRMCEEILHAEELDNHMCKFIQNQMETDDE